MFTRIDTEISKCRNRLNLLRIEANLLLPTPLIISTGDISDVDGFYALAKYAQSGADVLFIMNYPAYLNPTNYNVCEELELGLGFRYNTAAYLKTCNNELNNLPDQGKKLEKYKSLMNISNLSNPDTQADYVKRLFTDLGFVLASKAWNEATMLDGGIEKGRLFLCIGGINSINPFSDKNLKNEFYVYVDFFQMLNLDCYNHGSVYCLDNELSNIHVSLDEVFNARTQIYIDFNGSMAFYYDILRTKILGCRGSVKGVFIMGGVLSYEQPRTMPKIKGELNRFSCATMNQLYHPENTELFLRDIYSHHSEIPIYVVTNNAVHDLVTYTGNANQKQKTNEGWMNFLRENNIHSAHLENIASAFYNSHYNPPRKAFDFYSAFALVEKMNRRHLHGKVSFMYTDTVYGICMISNSKKTWEHVAAEYYDKINTSINQHDSEFTMNMKINFANEKSNVSSMVSIGNPRIVQSLFFEMKTSYRISMK